MKPGGGAGAGRQETVVPTGTVAAGVSEPLRTQAPTATRETLRWDTFSVQPGVHSHRAMAHSAPQQDIKGT